MAYLIRYGIMGHVARFCDVPPSAGRFHRGQAVVIQSNRGIELGEVLIRFDPAGLPKSIGGAEPAATDFSGRNETSGEPRVLRAAESEDLARAEDADASQPARFALCQRILQEGGWPWDLVDVEPLLDGHTTVLHYLGPRQIEDATMRARFRVACEFDVVFEPIGGELEGPEPEDLDQDHGCGSGCGSGGCGSGGGCGTAAAPNAGVTAASSATPQAAASQPTRTEAVNHAASVA